MARAMETLIMKICYIYTDWAHRPDKKYGGVGYYRVVKPAEYLKQWHEVDVFGEDLKTLGETPEKLWQKVFTTYDIVIIKQVDNEIAAGIMFFFAEMYDKKIILDLDDNYVEVRPDQPAYQVYHPGSQKRAIFHAVMRSASGLIVSTQPLADFYRSRIKKVYNIDKPIFVAPNCVDPKEWQPKKRFRKKVIGYAGSITHNGDLAVVMPSIAKLMREHKDWSLEILGGVKSEDVPLVFKDFDDEAFKRVQIKGGTQSWKGYPELLCSQRWTVGLAPLIDDEFNRGKSHIKWMEYALAGIPTLASRVYPYYMDIQGTKTMIDGETGYLFDSIKDFEHKLCSLMENDKIREELARQAKEYVLNNWDYEKHIVKWHEAIQTICNSQTQVPNLDLSKPVNDTQT